MPEFEFEFSEKDKQLVVSQGNASFSGTDYIRLTIYPAEAIDNIVDLPNSANGIDGKAIFFSSLHETPFDINVSPFGAGLDDFRLKRIGGSGNNNDFQIYRNETTQDIYIKPNEIFNIFELPQGDYKIQIDFLNQVSQFIGFDQPGAHYQFIIKQISTSRKEVRLKLLNENILNNSPEIANLTNDFNNGEPEFLDTGESNPNYKYQFKHILNIGNGDHIPIMNYKFDPITDGKDNQSIILKLYDALPINIQNLSWVTLEREILTTQIENTYYFSDIPDFYFGDGLQPDPQQNWINSINNDIGFQSLDEIAYSASIGEAETNFLISQSEYGYPNLNTNFNEFTNHTFFGSAKRKLVNFKNKVETIQGYYSEISNSLSVSSSMAHIHDDSKFTIQNRQNLFNKINEEIKNFTPYERFLYFDGQNESTASAPGLGKNYANPTTPVRDNVNLNTLYNVDGFKTVYHHTSRYRNSFDHTGLFNGVYYVHNKPFHNYSGSVYLSFLLKGNQSGSGIIKNWNVQKHAPSNGGNGLGVSLPQDSKYKNNMLMPGITGSEYRRYIIQTSHSYWIPNTNGNDLADLSYDGGDFNFGSTKVQILSGSKTGSYPIKDSTGQYPTNVVTQSGVRFSGSVMPAGDLFFINYINALTSSLSGSWRVDNETSGASVTNAMLSDFSGNFNTGSILGSPTISDGLKVGGRQYGKSFLFQSESSDAVSISLPANGDGDAGDFNYTRDDNFSLSIWAKRYHPNTGSADASAGDTQAIFHRGQSNNSYGIDYYMTSNQIRAGVRANGANEQVTFNTTDDLLEWTHIVFTFESGSAEGLKLYVNGDLKDTDTTTGDNYSITGSEHFSASAANANNVVESLKLGSQRASGGTGAYFNGYVQYPRVYSRVLTDKEVKLLYVSPEGVADTRITDVKITLKDPSDVLPFDQLYQTSSTAWTDWYNGMYESASVFDTDNIHSFENNLPLYIQESSDYDELKDFLALQGEQYDLIRNHIDSMGTIHNRGYKKTDSPPNNTLPMLLTNMGWEAINPFSGSLSDSLGSYLTGITSIDDIKNNTWRKTLNNLIYLYKSKGTRNSVRALMNIYGYPPDIINFQEFGGSTENQIGEGNLLSDSPPEDGTITLDTSMGEVTGSNVNFISSRRNPYNYIFNNNQDRILNLDWWMDSADVNTIEFVYKHSNTTNTQTILESSGSGSETLWDLRLVPSADGISSSFEFRLNNSRTGSDAIASNAISMSTSYSKILDGELWNVMLQRMTSSISGSGIQEYRLHSALQDKEIIKTYNYVTMSVSGGLSNSYITGAADSNYYANQNFVLTGSRHSDSSSNLYVGETMTGSLSEIKAWSTPLSISRFRQHTFNKFSTTGNSINSHKNELIYHFKLNENYTSASVSSSNQNLTIVDSSPTTTYSDYSFQKTGSIFTDGIVYGSDMVWVIQLSTQDNSTSPTSNNIFINPNKSVFGNLNPNNSPITLLTNQLGEKPKIKTSTRLELYRSPQNFIDNFILDNLGGFNFETLYGNPTNYYSQSYGELDTFREEFFEAHPITVDTNKFIRAHENMFNDSITEALQKIVPARSTFSDKNSNMGVEIRPTILEKQKYEYNEELSVEKNPNTLTGSLSPSPNIISGSEFVNPKSGSISVISVESITSGSKIELPQSGSIKISDSGSKNAVTNFTGSIINPYTASISALPSTTGSGIETSKDGIINYSTGANASFVNIHKNWGKGHITSSDTHFINYAGGTGSYGSWDYNTHHIDTRFHFYSIGDCEYYSASRGKASDFENSDRFYNRMMMTDDFHANVTYESLIHSNPGNQIGRMMGKTRYFITSSNGTITLPSNHISKFSYPFKERMIEGTQNTNPGFLNVRQEDYSSASFYRVKVTGGENQIIVKSGDPSLDTEDKIIY